MGKRISFDPRNIESRREMRDDRDLIGDPSTFFRRESIVKDRRSETVKRHVRRYSVIDIHTPREMNEPGHLIGIRRNRATPLINTRFAGRREFILDAEFNRV